MNNEYILQSWAHATTVALKAPKRLAFLGFASKYGFKSLF